MASEISQILNPPAPITSFAYNKDRTQLAVCPNSNEVYIYHKSGSEWPAQPTHVLREHDKLVTSIDWAPNTNRIVTCSQDRNAYVWTWANNQWKPALVLLRINRAATQVKWSPKEDKFAVASGARCISVCYFEKDNDWWVSKHIRKPIRSTVLSIDWHPNNALLAAGSADFKARVFMAAIKGVDSKPEPTVWGDKTAFGDCLAEYASGSACGWVHDIAFSPEGDAIAWVGHGSNLCAVYGKDGQVHNVRSTTLPFRALLWLTPKSIVCAGHSNNPTLFSFDGSTFKFVRELDAGKVGEEKVGNSAMDKFRKLDTRGSEDVDAKLKTLHQNAINGVKLFKGTRNAVQQFSTSGVDGQLIVWDTKSLEQALAGLKIA